MTSLKAYFYILLCIVALLFPCITKAQTTQVSESEPYIETETIKKVENTSSPIESTESEVINNNEITPLSDTSPITDNSEPIDSATVTHNVIKKTGREISKINKNATKNPIKYSENNNVALYYSLGKGTDNHVYGDEELRFIERKSTSFGKLAALNILGAFANQSIKTGDDFLGDTIEGIPNIGKSLIIKKLDTALSEYFIKNPNAIPKIKRELTVKGGEWLLIYSHLLDAETPYKLNYTTQFFFPKTKNGDIKYKGLILSECRPSKVEENTLDAWKADNYKKVKQVAEQYAEKCVNIISSHFPEMFPENTKK